MYPPLSLLLPTVIVPLVVLAVLAARRLRRARLASNEPLVEASADGREASANETPDAVAPSQTGTGQPPLAAAIERKLVELASVMRSLSTLTGDLYETRRTFASNAIEVSREAQSHEAMVSRHYLTVILSGERFAINMLHVSGALEATQLIADPALPSKIRRAIKLEGSLVPVIDLGARLAGQPIEIGWSTRIVLLELPRNGIQQTFGVLVDVVGKIVEIDPANIEPPSTSSSHAHREIVLGLGWADDHLITLLDIERVLLPGGVTLPPPSEQSPAQEHMPG